MHYICYAYVGTRALTYSLLTHLARAYKAGNISETVEDRAKATIKDLYIAYISQKMAKYSLVMTPTLCRVAGCTICIRPTYSGAGAFTGFRLPPKCMTLNDI